MSYDIQVEQVRVHRRELPGGPVAFTFHVGPYETYLVGPGHGVGTAARPMLRFSAS